MQEQTGRVVNLGRPVGITVRVLTLGGLIALRDELKRPGSEGLAQEYRDAYFRDEHGSLRRIFPKSKKRG